MSKQKPPIMDVVVVGSVEWAQARKAAYEMASVLSKEVSALNEVPQIKDAYSPVAWVNICRQLRVVTDGMITMRLLAENKTNKQIYEEAGIDPASVAAYKAWNTMYARNIEQGIKRKITIKAKTHAILQADIDWLHSIGISVSIPEEAA